MFFWNSVAFSIIQQTLAIWSQSSLNIWKFMFTHCWRLAWRIFSITLLAVWDECNCVVVWAFFGSAFLWDWNETDLFQSCGHCWVFQIFWHIECSTFTASLLRIQNSSTGIPSPPLALFKVMLPKAHLTSHFKMSELSHHHDYLGHEDLFLPNSSVYLPPLVNIFFC